MVKTGRKNPGQLRVEMMGWAVREFVRQGGRPIEFRAIVNFFARESDKEIRRALGIRFTVRSEFMLMSIERPGSGMSTMFDGTTKLVTLTEWGWSRKPIMADDMKPSEPPRPGLRLVKVS